MEERSVILSHGRPQYDVVNWINSERLELHHERKAHRVRRYISTIAPTRWTGGSELFLG